MEHLFTLKTGDLIQIKRKINSIEKQFLNTIDCIGIFISFRSLDTSGSFEIKLLETTGKMVKIICYSEMDSIEKIS
jgi:hypothetical protein